MLPQPFQLMMIGGAINEWQSAEQMERLEMVVQRAGQLEQQFQSTIDAYQQLGEAFVQLQKYAASVAEERDQLQGPLAW